MKPSAHDECLLEWFEMRDLQVPKVEGATWLPLHCSHTSFEHGEAGHAGHREEYLSLESLIIPSSRREEFDHLNWHSLTRNNSDTGWADEDGLISPGLYDAQLDLQYPVLVQRHDTGEQTEWHLLQELQMALNLRRVGDEWIDHSENDLVVARLTRKPSGTPSRLEVRSTYLRDYLCAKQATLLMVSFWYRKAVEKDIAPFGLPEGKVERTFEHGEWDCFITPIHEGGRPFGMAGVMMHMWRESVDPESDNPTMPQPWNDPSMRSETSDISYVGEKLWSATGRLWTRAWVQPASTSPRVRREKVESTIHFLVDNQEHKTLSGSLLAEHRGWLWFKPSVIPALLSQKKSFIEWHTRDTGTIGPDSIQTLHFGINAAGLINVLAYKMASLPIWVQQLWVAHNTSPEGGLSEELHMSQNLARPAQTLAPEAGLLFNLHALCELTSSVFGASLLRGHYEDKSFLKAVHRFYGDSFESYCQLCKELHRHVSERIDIGVINSKIDASNAKEANDLKLREIKRLAFWLDKAGHDGRDLTKPLAAVCDLRVGDAHSGRSDLRDSLPLLGIPKDTDDFMKMCLYTLGVIANTVGKLCEIVEEIGQTREKVKTEQSECQ